MPEKGVDIDWMRIVPGHTTGLVTGVYLFFLLFIFMAV
jgi:hypothetical protein